MTIDSLVQLLRAARIDLSDEKLAQQDIEQLLTQAGILFEREVRLTPRDIIDFLVGDIGIEVKLRGARKKEIYRQLCRYAQYPQIGQLLLASNLSMGLPPEIEG